MRCLSLGYTDEIDVVGRLSSVDPVFQRLEKEDHITFQILKNFLAVLLILMKEPDICLYNCCWSQTERHFLRDRIINYKLQVYKYLFELMVSGVSSPITCKI